MIMMTIVLNNCGNGDGMDVPVPTVMTVGSNLDDSFDKH